MAGECRAAGAERVIGIGRGSAPERHHRIADELVDGAGVGVDLARHAIEIFSEQRHDAVAEPFGKPGEAGDIRKQHGHWPDRAARPGFHAVRSEGANDVARQIFAERG